MFGTKWTCLYCIHVVLPRDRKSLPAELCRALQSFTHFFVFFLLVTCADMQTKTSIDTLTRKNKHLLHYYKCYKFFFYNCNTCHCYYSYLLLFLVLTLVQTSTDIILWLELLLLPLFLYILLFSTTMTSSTSALNCMATIQLYYL